MITVHEILPIYHTQTDYWIRLHGCQRLFKVLFKVQSVSSLVYGDLQGTQFFVSSTQPSVQMYLVGRSSE